MGSSLQRWIMHVDMDAFYASVEILDNPELKGLPVIVGGRSARGVVSTCSYEARKFGVHSAMPLFEARRLCPHGVYLPVRPHRYAEMSGKIMAIFRETSPLVEQLSIDEAFLDLTGMERLGGAETIARKVQNRIMDELKLSASVGLAPNKFLAKLASDMRKPHGFVKIAPEEAALLLAPMPVSKIFGIGRSAEEKLKQFGIEKIGQLAAADITILRKVFGINAEQVKLLARGLDDRPVINEEEAKSIGKENTFDRDLTDFESCREEVLDLCGQVGWRLRREKLAGHTVTLKVKFADFHTITRSATSDRLIAWDEDIFALVEKLLQKINVKPGVRLLGVSVSNLFCPEDEPTLGFEEDERLKKRNQAIDALKGKFGENIIKRGIAEKNIK
ncbi:MAG: DNA polymerase IV [Succiniclasticum sp.]|uniref:DNA polymerase IV n=1 Tax=Succiniclasticum sp. TaxID=2775030 RepID=UPI002A91851C|nr:DNA polymerase IV [Succiniclasticum sp.]MDY6290902.1 DNA polymerase IV [Succiniclasticum sp.]